MKVMSKDELISKENIIKEEFRKGNLRVYLHMCGGNEDNLIEVFKNIEEDDWVFATHRNHYHCLLKGMPVEELLEKIKKYGSMYIFDKKRRIFTSSIVGGVLPIATGVALGIKLRNEKEHVWVFIGDMAANTGMYHECLNYSIGHDLPITFVVEDNGYGIMNTKKVWGDFNKKNNKEIRFEYKRKYPHVGIGEWINFD